MRLVTRCLRVTALAAALLSGPLLLASTAGHRAPVSSAAAAPTAAQPNDLGWG